MTEPRALTPRIALFSLLLLGLGCGKQAEEEEEDLGEIPFALARVEALAEDSFDIALDGDVATVGLNAGELRTSWSAYRSEAEAKGARPALLEGMDRDIDALVAMAAQPGVQPRPLARSANAVCAWMGELFGLYGNPIPPGVSDLDFLGRELFLDGEEAAFTLGATHAEALRQTWGPVKVVIEPLPGGAAVAEVYEANIANIAEAISAGDGVELTRQAYVGLELVDVMEKLFGPNADPAD